MGGKQNPFDERSMSPLFAVPTRRIIPRTVFRSMYPLAYALGLRPVSVGSYDHEGFDIDEVERKLGAKRFASLLDGLKEMFCCGHRNWPADHPDPARRNCEVHCVYARDLEVFLKGPEMMLKGK
jgi:hypothetical protein